MQGLLRGVVSAAVILGLALCEAGGAQAGGFQFNPAIISLTARAHTGSITVTNPGDAPMRVEVQAFDWAQGTDGQALLNATDQLLVFPQLIVIPPGASRQVRLAALAAPADREQTYQISITEIPVASSVARTSAVAVRMRADIPVFFGPVVEREAGSIAAASLRNGALSFTVANLGTVHFEAKNLHVIALGPDMQELFAQDVSTQFVLAGGKREFHVVLPRKECSAVRALTIRVDADAQHLSQTLDLAPGACGA
ncbi:MAG: molecular chaperone [Vulcanimicrobiaceae bacterium]